MKREANVPDKIDHKHVGSRVLYRLPNQALVFEGIIDGLSPDGEYVKIGKRWIENGAGAILSFLPNSQRRKDALS
jgi:hypothetical protein